MRDEPSRQSLSRNHQGLRLIDHRNIYDPPNGMFSEPAGPSACPTDNENGCTALLTTPSRATPPICLPMRRVATACARQHPYEALPHLLITTRDNGTETAGGTARLFMPAGSVTKHRKRVLRGRGGVRMGRGEG